MHKYRGKKVAIIGLSVEGQDSAKFFYQEGAILTCCDRRTREQLGSMYDMLSAYSSKFQLGLSYLDNLERFDLIVRTPGMALSTPRIAEAIERGQCVSTQTRIFLDECQARVIGVTGTKGKGTTSTLIAEIIKLSQKRVFLGGNVGVPLLSIVRQIKKTDWVVLELSSFQLEDCTKSPNISVVLRITQDHLANYDKNATNYHKTRADYVYAKESIVRYQSKHDTVIVNDDDDTSKKFVSKTQARKLFFSIGNKLANAYVLGGKVFMNTNGRIVEICSSADINLRGEHNLENIAAAVLACVTAGVSVPIIRKAVHVFQGLPHRLEFVRTVGSVSFYDDSFSTVPETAIAALRSFSEPIILIAGGSEKGSDFTQMGNEIVQKNVHTLIAIGDMATKIVKAAKDAGYKGVIVTGCTSMKQIVERAFVNAPEGAVVLLSPACASFDMFENYKERGRLFKQEVHALHTS